MRPLLLSVLVAAAAISSTSTAEPRPCEAERERCRADCFDHLAGKDEPAFAKCKDDCNRAWLKCSRAPK